VFSGSKRRGKGQKPTAINRTYGAGDGNRTHVRSLGSFYTAIVRRPLTLQLIDYTPLSQSRSSVLIFPISVLLQLDFVGKTRIDSARNPVTPCLLMPNFLLARGRMPAQGQHLRENLLEVRLQINAVNLLHPRMIKMCRHGWRRAMLFVNFSNRNFECHMFPLFVVLQSFVHFSVDYEESVGLQMWNTCCI
jgi:hypothetical protein